jgi:hypothetical protein
VAGLGIEDWGLMKNKEKIIKLLINLLGNQLLMLKNINKIIY